MNNSRFIYTSDKGTADILKRNGFNQISCTGNNYIFENTGKLLFADIDTSKIVYTNKLLMS